jgi:5-methylcytosine-specific restriction protein B
VLEDGDVFRDAERWLMTPSTTNAWWFVASPDRWKWQQMFDDGSVVYHRGRIEHNYQQLAVGDLVFSYEATPTRRIVALARVADWSETEDDAGDLPILKPISHVDNGPTWEEIKRDPTLADSEPVRQQTQGTLFAVTDDEAECLLDLIAARDPRAAAHGRKARELAVGWLTTVTFHPSYTYEDFVEGYKPDQDGEGSGLRLTLTEGIFMKVCTAARAHPDVPHLLIIDEINRGNLPKIFGELLTVLERDKRCLDVTLPQSGGTFSVPENVYIIGTMNTADRSVRLLDAALRRRFAFMELMPRSDLLEGAAVGPLALDEFLDELNRRIRARYGREKQIGHSYFLEDGQPVTKPETFARVMRDEVMPLLQEYAYDHYGDLKDLLGAGVVDSDNETLQEDIIGDPEAFVAALYEAFQGTNGSSA